MDQQTEQGEIVNIIKLICLWFHIRALEATAQGQMDALPLVRCEETRCKIAFAHMRVLVEIDRLKAERRRIKRGNGIRAVCIGG